MRTPRKYKIAPWARPDSELSNKSNRPAIYHCVSRVVDRRFIFHAEEKEHFRKLMRLYEQFCGVRILSYCLNPYGDSPFMEKTIDIFTSFLHYAFYENAA